jgi:hypothetical protein
MCDMRRDLAPSLLPNRRCTVEFVYLELSAGRKLWWLVIEGGKVDLRSVGPGYEVDLYVRSSLRSMISVWMGVSTLKAEIESWQPVSAILPVPQISFFKTIIHSQKPGAKAKLRSVR